MGNAMEKAFMAAGRRLNAQAATSVTGLLHPTGSGGSVEALMRAMAASIGWTGGLWTDLFNVEMREAGFNLAARNPSSGAYGLAQFINGPSEYYQYGGNPNTAAGQITGMLNYIRQRYGTPAGAWAHELNFGWYDQGGWLMPGMTMAVNRTGRPERVTPADQKIKLEVKGTGSTSEHDRYMINWLQRIVRNQGGGDVQAAFGTHW
jgi:hypothetical protein